jgi:hypothetical protein
MATVVFWGALGMLVYVYVGYPALIWLLATLRPRPVRRQPITPKVSFVCTVYNEEAVIAEKLRATLAFDYPPEQLEILIASDGSTDRTDEIVRSFGDRVRLLRVEGRVGKTATQNEAVRAATGEILVFSDATTIYRPDAVRQIVQNFADPDVGLATGGAAYIGSDGLVHEGRAAYWNYESFVRSHESAFNSVLGAAGCFHAMRKPLYNFLGADLISDVAQAVKTVQKGYRAVVDDSAFCYEPAEPAPPPLVLPASALAPRAALGGAVLPHRRLRGQRVPARRTLLSLGVRRAGGVLCAGLARLGARAPRGQGADAHAALLLLRGERLAARRGMVAHPGRLQGHLGNWPRDRTDTGLAVALRVGPSVRGIPGTLTRFRGRCDGESPPCRSDTPLRGRAAAAFPRWG